MVHQDDLLIIGPPGKLSDLRGGDRAVRPGSFVALKVNVKVVVRGRRRHGVGGLRCHRRLLASAVMSPSSSISDSQRASQTNLLYHQRSKATI
ncbi:hypothetical protein MHPYR_470041 [uncultured Mycobacterium sp.]|uniref:Uncharacterized protein n=1 Tax=uncultured Mycobacterium sp. TaxID=171292 RepID=A0A1Y5PG53_9MYCO|nr:hypothetical protein MHPYR_470041 [uncultured Mycobacterium sp.]